MGRRKLTKQQRARVQKEPESHWLQGQLISRYGKSVELYVPDAPVDKFLAAQLPAKFQGNTPIEDLVVGDWVYVDPETMLIETAQPRDSALIRIRRSANLSQRSANTDDQLSARGKIVAANVTQLCIVVAPVPFIERIVLDEYLLAAQVQDIQPCIIANKNDLEQAKAPEYKQYLKDYEALGLQVIQTCASTEFGLAGLTNHLKDHTSVLMGTSGVGKSSLLNMLIGQDIATTGGISEGAALGKHTTTTARLYHLPSGGQLIDSPGIREFKIAVASPQALFFAYKDLYAGNQCQYSNCTHREEPNCAVKKALEQGRAFQWRYDNYRTLYQSLVEGD